MRDGLRMDAYFYSFTPTGVVEVDRILSAVATAGKAYHHTEDWTATDFGESQEARIQRVADAAAQAFATVAEAARAEALREAAAAERKRRQHYNAGPSGMAARRSSELAEEALLARADALSSQPAAARTEKPPMTDAASHGLGNPHESAWVSEGGDES